MKFVSRVEVSICNINRNKTIFYIVYTEVSMIKNSVDKSSKRFCEMPWNRLLSIYSHNIS